MRDEQKFRRNMRISLGIFAALFALLIIYLGFSVIEYGGKWYATPYNPRLSNASSSVDGGTIYDINGTALAKTENSARVYNTSKAVRRATCHVVGDAYGKSYGAETVFAKYIYGINKGVIERLDDAAKGTSDKGSDITLTIDAELSEYIYNKMGKRYGSVVLLNYKTGEIIASVSVPTFDPDTVGEKEPDDSGLVDRATMGAYPPGSTMKIVTAAAAVKDGIDLSYTCTGEDIVDGQKVTCAGGKAHGELTLKKAFAKSCNTYFANLSVKLGGARLLREAENFGYNAQFNFDDIRLYTSKFEVSASEGDVAWAGIGQYNDLVTPMHAAMIAGAVANDGVMMEPKLLKYVGAKNARIHTLTPAQYKRVMAADAAKTVKEYMKTVVESGTGTSAAVAGATMYGKTGTAEYEDGGEVKNHSWFVGFIDDEEHPYAVSVILEGAGYGSRYAAPLASAVIAKAIK